MAKITPEASALSTFSALCAEQDLLKLPRGLSEEDVLDGLTDETTLLRFLQANRLQPDKALEQFRQAIEFSAKHDAVRLYDLISEADFEDTRRQYPHWTGRRDRSGRPILMFDMAALGRQGMAHWRETRDLALATIESEAGSQLGSESGESSESTLKSAPNMAQRALAYYSHLTRFVLPLCSAVRSQPVTNCVYIVDASSLSMKQAWDVREFARDISWILQTCYPETIYRVYCCNVPGFLARIWSFLKPFIDPGTAAKIHFLRGTEASTVLSQEIAHEDLPANVGGGFQFQTGMLPSLDEPTRKSLEWIGPEELPMGPLKWIQTDGERRAVATGTGRRVELARLV
ncbi:CRAL-TRIO domain-containing protein [Aspergillus unguis]